MDTTVMRRQAVLCLLAVSIVFTSSLSVAGSAVAEEEEQIPGCGVFQRTIWAAQRWHMGKPLNRISTEYETYTYPPNACGYFFRAEGEILSLNFSNVASDWVQPYAVAARHDIVPGNNPGTYHAKGYHASSQENQVRRS